jgi:hypothetical protein
MILQKLQYEEEEEDTHHIRLKSNENRFDLTAYKRGM